MILGKDASLEEVVKELTELSKDNVKPVSGYPKKLKTKASKLLNELKEITLLTNFKAYKKIDQLLEIDLTEYGIKKALELSSEIKQDIKKALGWIQTWFGFYNDISTGNGISKEDKHLRLINIGKVIMARAVDLCPKATGELAKSAILLELDNSVIIVFNKYYAMYVHEKMEADMKYPHPNHPSNPNCHGRSKFLEIAVQEVFPTKQVDINLLSSGAIGVQIFEDDLD